MKKSSIPTSKRQNGAPLMIFSEGLTKSNSVAPSEPEDLLLVTFDDSDYLSSESEKELEPKFSGRTGPSLIHLNENVHARDPEPTQSEAQELEGSSFVEKGNSGSNRKPWLDSFSDDSDNRVPKRIQGRKFKADHLPNRTWKLQGP